MRSLKSFSPLISFVAALFLFISSTQASEDLTPSGTNPTPRVKEFSWMSVDTWNKMYAEDIAIAEKGDVDLLFVGDSITAGWNWDIWQKYFTPYKPANFGIGGDHTGNLLWRLKYGHAEKLKPKAVVMLIGVNNFGHLNETPDQVFAGIKACVVQLRKIYPHAKILVNGVFPFEEAASSPKRELVKTVNKLVAKLADNQHIFVRDYGNIFLQADGTISKEIMGDFLHPTAKGYQLWVDAMLPDIQKLMQPNSSAQHLNSITASDAHISLMGRAKKNPDGSQSFGYPGVSFSVEFEGKELSVEACSTSNQSYLEVVVDNNESQIIKLSTDNLSYPILKETISKKHKVSIVHRSETWHGIVTLKGFQTDGKFLTAPQLPLRKILVLGDSVTCGEAIERVAGNKKETSWWNPSLSYGMLTAKAFNAQAQLVCMGGHGLVRTWDGKTNDLNLPEYYGLTIPQQESPSPSVSSQSGASKWNQSNFDPDVIVSAIGTNDFSQGIPDREAYVVAYKNFLTQVLADHKKAQIFLTEGSILNDDKKFALTDYLKETINRTADGRVHYVHANYYAGDATDAHPTKEQHAAMAADLIAEIKTVMKW